jgi:hypothetical protein
MNRSWLSIVSLALFVIGLAVLLRSVPWGMDAANAFLRAQGGGMDTNQFVIVVQESISVYRWIGGILAAIGGLGFVRSIELR